MPNETTAPKGKRGPAAAEPDPLRAMMVNALRMEKAAQKLQEAILEFAKTRTLLPASAFITHLTLGHNDHCQDLEAGMGEFDTKKIRLPGLHGLVSHLNHYPTVAFAAYVRAMKLEGVSLAEREFLGTDPKDPLTARILENFLVYLDKQSDILAGEPPTIDKVSNHYYDIPKNNRLRFRFLILAVLCAWATEIEANRAILRLEVVAFASRLKEFAQEEKVSTREMLLLSVIEQWYAVQVQLPRPPQAAKRSGHAAVTMTDVPT